MSPRPPFLRPRPFPPRPPPPLITALFGRFIGTTSASDSSPAPRQLRLLDFLSRPGIALATAGQARPPKFRRVPFRRDMVSDPDRAAAPRKTVPHMLPSTVLNGSASAKTSISWLNTYPNGSLCTLRERRHRRPRNTRYRAVRYDITRAGLSPAGTRQLLGAPTLASRRALPLTCAGLPPAGSRQLRLAHVFAAVTSKSGRVRPGRPPSGRRG